MKKISLLVLLSMLLPGAIIHSAAGEEKDSDQPANKANKFNDLIVTSDTSFAGLYPVLADGFTMVGVDFNEFMRTRLIGHYPYDIITNDDGQSSNILNHVILEAEHFITTRINAVLQHAFDHGIETGADFTPGETDLLEYAVQMSEIDMLPKCFGDDSLDESLWLAVIHGNISIARILLKIGADVNYLKKATGSLLHCATYKNNVKMVEFLIESGVNVNLKNSRGLNALFWPCNTNYQNNCKKCRIQIIELMILSGVNLNDKINKEGTTLLMHAAENGYAEMVQRLILAGANTDLVNSNGQTAFDIATPEMQQVIQTALQERQAAEIAVQQAAQLDAFDLNLDNFDSNL